METAEKLLKTYDLQELLDIADISEVEVIQLLLSNGLLDPETPHVL